MELRVSVNMFLNIFLFSMFRFGELVISIIIFKENLEGDFCLAFLKACITNFKYSIVKLK
ncbi:hypothetical protein BpHYR1_034608 [Brachionus plicatilis]|uniref:Uncharacterized protein n=1 Tax=Brachionus plicatilis TaxID=10195 RepID=A0A3M7T021_BRAPC|nr:hypothetical protein BpHYR1_034608 [Brachionus plicatilis]